MRKDPIAAELGRRGGRKGGRARALSLTPEQRREIAQRAAAARWQRPANGDGTVPGSLAHTPVARARGAAQIDGRMLDAFVLEDGRRLIGLLSAALALDYDAEQMAERASGHGGEATVTFHVPGDWRLIRGIAPATLVDICRDLVETALADGRPERTARGRALRAAGLLAAAAEEGVPGLVDGAVRPVGEPARPAGTSARAPAIVD
ncbi:MAG TPA: hypothetical protein PKA13_23750 [Geminicoccaceae bacterium]|nr:hypothetical protein [Geminicoccus sp.]HMU52813.1 hypothetical protein [Geminicoccaceae bacterium]